ncbi:MAG: T9SS type A sorting domain-containing protein [Cytophagaceae bacterium]|nr:T9SS type A sorting domain-containing protein [Cytophagaceae bacterium]
MLFTRIRLAVFIAVLFPLSVWAQDGSLDLTFNALDQTLYGNGKATDGQAVYCSAVTSDNKLLIGGGFTTFNGTSVKRLAKINLDGSLDPLFNSGTGSNGNVRKIILLSSGKFFILGGFTSYNGNTVPGIAKVNADGSFDATFSLGSTPPDYAIQNADLLSDGKLIVSGQFTTINGVAKKYLARLSEDGVLDPSFEANLTVQKLLKGIQSDGKIIIYSYPNLTRVNADGSPDATFTTIGLSGGYYPAETIILPNDKLIVYLPGPAPKVAGYNADGIIDPSFQQGTLGSGGVTVMKVKADNKIFIAGNFTNYLSSGRGGMVLINTDGTVDLSFLQAANYSLTHISILYDNKLVVSHASGLALLSATGSLVFNFKNEKGANASVRALVVQADDKIVLAGAFSIYNQKPAIKVVRINADGSIDPSFISAIDDFYYYSIESINLQPDGKLILAGGNFITRLKSDGSFDPSFSPQGIGGLYASCIQPDGKILIGGSSGPGLARLNVDGSLDNSFTLPAGFSGIVNSIAVQSNGKILIGGTIICTSSDFPTKRYFMRLNSDGSVDQLFKSGIGPDQPTYVITVAPDDKIYFGGPLTFYNGLEIGHFHRLNPDGSIDNTFIKGLGNFPSQPTCVFVQTNGKVLVQMINGDFKRLNADGSLDNSFIAGRTDGVGYPFFSRSIGVASDGSVYLGGDFTKYNNINRNYIAKINSSPISDNCKYFQLSFKTASEISCGSTTPTATAQATGGREPFLYEWQTTPSQSNATASITSAGIYTVHATDANGCSTDASLLITGPTSQIQIDLTNNLVATTLRKGFNSTLKLNALNQGCISASGKLKLILNNLVSYISALPVPSAISGDTLIWDISNLVYGGILFQPVVTLKTSTSATTGQQICFPVLVSSLEADANPDNDKKYFCFTVFNSYDPNDKQVYPTGSCNSHYIKDDQLLTYTVRFQNTGNASAINITITDTLSEGLDLSTARVVSHSHPVIAEVVGDNLIKFHFDNIQLTAAVTNDAASQGYVVFEIKPITGSSTDVRIDNKVNIYFDYNDPIITNTVYHTLTGSIPTVDVFVTQDASALTANASNATFQWINCSANNTIVSNATTNAFTITNTNSYAVIVDQDGCKDTSSCYIVPVVTSSEEVNTTTGVTVYPNPSNGFSTVVCAQDLQNATIKILNANGNIVFEKNDVSGNSIKLDVSKQSNGLYFLEVWQAGVVRRIKFVKD